MAPAGIRAAKEAVVASKAIAWPVAANRSRRRATFHLRDQRSHILYMKKADSTNTLEQEPIGIVISRGPSKEQAPTFFAYVWGPDPETPEATSATIAA